MSPEGSPIAKRIFLVALAALLAVTAACTRSETTPSTQPLAPPDTFGTTTTVPVPASTVNTAGFERAAIQPVDPLSLEPVEGYEPIPVGDWFEPFWAAVSDNETWLALNTGTSEAGLTEVRLINLYEWETVATWDGSPNGSTLTVLDDGSVYGVTEGRYGPEFTRFFIDPQQTVTVAELPVGYWWSGPHIGDGLAVIFGSKTVGEDPGGVAAVVTVALETGEVEEIPVSGLETGTVAEVEIGEDYPGVVHASPAAVWDSRESRMLIVHADRDVVTEVDVLSGEVTDHEFGAGTWDWGPEYTGTAEEGGGAFASNSRSAVLSRDGRTLFVATASGGFVVEDEGWSATTESIGMSTIDTETWQIIDRLDAPVSEIRLSPDGARLIATGYRDIQGLNRYEFASLGFYVIDPVGLEVLTHHEPEAPEQSYGNFSFSRDSRYGYVTSWRQQSGIDVIDLDSGEILHTRSGVEIQLLGEVGILGGAQPLTP